MTDIRTKDFFFRLVNRLLLANKDVYTVNMASESPACARSVTSKNNPHIIIFAGTAQEQ